MELKQRTTTEGSRSRSGRQELGKLAEGLFLHRNDDPPALLLRHKDARFNEHLDVVRNCRLGQARDIDGVAARHASPPGDLLDDGTLDLSASALAIFTICSSRLIRCIETYHVISSQVRLPGFEYFTEDVCSS
jgi:hypothetical protein